MNCHPYRSFAIDVRKAEDTQYPLEQKSRGSSVRRIHEENGVHLQEGGREQVLSTFV